MSAFLDETVLSVHHWTDRLFSFTTTRDTALRFSNGHFTMIGLRVDGKPLLRAYSIVSANYEEHLEFFSIKVQDGPLTSRLQHIKVGDKLVVGKTHRHAAIDYLLPGKNLYLIGTGTGLAPFLCLIRDPATYEKYEKVILFHGVREVKELAYAEYITHDLPNHEYLGDMVKEQLLYYPSVTRAVQEPGPCHRPAGQRPAPNRPGPAQARPCQRPHHDLRQPRAEQRHARAAQRPRLHRRQHHHAGRLRG